MSAVFSVKFAKMKMMNFECCLIVSKNKKDNPIDIEFQLKAKQQTMRRKQQNHSLEMNVGAS